MYAYIILILYIEICLQTFVHVSCMNAPSITLASDASWKQVHEAHAWSDDTHTDTSAALDLHVIYLLILEDTIYNSTCIW